MDCEARLTTLPAPVTSEPSSFVLSLVASFCADVKSYVQGQALAATLVQDTRRTYKTFCKDVRATAPPFLPYVDGKAKALDTKFLYEVDDDDAEEPISLVGNLHYIFLKDVKERIAQYVFSLISAEVMSSLLQIYNTRAP